MKEVIFNGYLIEVTEDIGTQQLSCSLCVKPPAGSGVCSRLCAHTPSVLKTDEYVKSITKDPLAVEFAKARGVKEVL